MVLIRGNIMAIILLVIVYIAFVGLGLPDSLLGVSWPVMYTDFGVDEGMAGTFSLAISIGTIISSLFSGKITQKLGTGKVTALSVTLTAIGILLVSKMSNIYYLFLIAIPLGLGAGAVDTSLNDYVARHFKPRHMSWLHSLWGVGAMTGPVLMSFFLESGNWRKGYFTVAVILFFISSLLFITLPVWNSFEKMRGIDTQREQKENREKYSLSSALRQSGVKTSMVAFMFYCGIEMIIGLWGSTYLINEENIDASTAALWISFFFLAVTVTRAVSGALTIRIKNKTQLRAGQIIIVLGILLLMLPISSKMALCAIVLIGIGCAPIYPLMIHETPKRFKNDSAAIMGLQLASAYCGLAFLPLGFGYLAAWIDFGIMPKVLLIFIVIVIFSTEKINKLTKNRQINR